jgi:hypothetical protein
MMQTAYGKLIGRVVGKKNVNLRSIRLIRDILKHIDSKVVSVGEKKALI